MFPIIFFSEESFGIFEADIERGKYETHEENGSDGEENSNIISITIPCQEFADPVVVYPIEESDFAEVYRKIP